MNVVIFDFLKICRYFIQTAFSTLTLLVRHQCAAISLMTLLGYQVTQLNQENSYHYIFVQF